MQYINDTNNLDNTFSVEKNGQRLDAFLVSILGDTSRSKAQKMIVAGNVLVNGKKKSASYKVKTADIVATESPAVIPFELEPWDYPLDIIFENEDFVLINKPVGISVHPSLDSNTKTIVNALLYHYNRGLSTISGHMRPGIVHRLDKDTSGCLLIAKHDKAHRYFAQLFKDRNVSKTYLALVKGKLEPKTGTIDSPVGRSYRDRKKMSVHTFRGRNALTHYKVLSYTHGCSLLEVKIETGRTHQIRVHLSAIGHPLVMDATYGDRNFNKEFMTKYGLGRQFLHAQKIAFKGLDGKEYEFCAPLPADLAFL